MGLLTIQFGQCGNQIGQTLFNYLLNDITETKTSQVLKSVNLEYINLTKESWFTENQNSTYTPRSILVDTENKVVSSLLNRKDSLIYKNIVTQTSGGSANNWALGYTSKANLLINDVKECTRKEMEKCDNVLHILSLLSSGGGTGSGVGSRILENLREEYPNKNMINIIILPYERGEVVTQSYNTLLTLAKLYDITDASVIMENDVLHYICNTLLTIKNVDLCHINFIIAQKLCAIFQPVHSFSVTNFLSHLTPHPNFKLVQIKTTPHIPREHIEYESVRGWPNLVLQLRNRLRASSHVNEEVRNFACIERRRLASHYYKSVGNILITRGGILPDSDITKPFLEKHLYPKWVPINNCSNHYHQPRRLDKTQEFLALASNNNSICNTLDSVLTQAWALFQHKAYLHFYAKYGINESAFKKAFEKMESICNNYKKL